MPRKKLEKKESKKPRGLKKASESKVKKIIVNIDKQIKENEPILKKLPVVDGYQVINVCKDGHTKTYYLCDAISEKGDKVTIHVLKSKING